MYTFELKDYKNLSIDDLWREAEESAWHRCDLLGELLAYVDVDNDYTLENGVRTYKVTVYSQPYEQDKAVTLSIGDIVTNDLDGKQYKITAISPRKSNVTELIGSNVYLAGPNGENVVVYEWEVTKHGN